MFCRGSKGQAGILVFPKTIFARVRQTCSTCSNRPLVLSHEVVVNINMIFPPVQASSQNNNPQSHAQHYSFVILMYLWKSVTRNPGRPRMFCKCRPRHLHPAASTPLQSLLTANTITDFSDTQAIVVLVEARESLLRLRENASTLASASYSHCWPPLRLATTLVRASKAVISAPLGGPPTL